MGQCGGSFRTAPPRIDAMSKWLNLVLSMLGLQRISSSVPATTATAESMSKGLAHREAIVYPPRDPGLPVEDVTGLFDGQAELLGMLRIHAAESATVFEQRFLGPIRRMAEYVNSLPGSSSDLFAGSGGLVRAGVETAFTCFRASDGRIFTGDLGVEERHLLEGRWRYICFCAGLVYPLGGALASMSVVDSAGRKWAPELEAVTTWCREFGAGRMYVSWRFNEPKLGPNPIAATFVLRLIGRENIEWLNQGSPDLVATLVDVVSGLGASKASIAGGLVKDMWSAVAKRESARRHQNYGRLAVGSNVAPYIIDAISEMLKSKWVLNDSILHADATGAYLEWPRAGIDIIEYCRAQETTGIPSNESALLAMLVSTSMVEAGVEGVALVEIADAAGEVKTAVKITKPGLVLPEGITLESLEKTRPVLLSALRSKDPIAVHEIAEVPREASSPVEKVAKAKLPTLEQVELPIGVSVADEEEDDVTEGRGDELDSACAPVPEEVSERLVPSAAAPSTPSSQSERENVKPRLQEVSKSKPGANAVVEAPEIRYASLLSAEVTDKFGTYEAELLGRLVHIWRTKSNGGRVMRMCEHGAAFDMTLLSDHAKDPVTFLNRLGTEGYLYTAPETPRKMVYNLPRVEGGDKTVMCFILAHHAAKRLAIP